MRCLEHTIYEKGSVAAVNARSIQEIDKNFVPSSCIPPTTWSTSTFFSPPLSLMVCTDPEYNRKILSSAAAIAPTHPTRAYRTSHGTPLADGCVFATDSPYLALVVQLNGVVHMMHMPRTGNSGFDSVHRPTGHACTQISGLFAYFAPYRACKGIWRMLQ